MELHRYRFTSTWEIGAEPDDVYRALRDVACYPLWWPEIRRARRVDDRTGELVVRSFLPYDLVFSIAEARHDPGAGVLEARMAGDLRGWSRWTVTAGGVGTSALFEEDVEPGKPLMRWLALPGRLAFRANHALMMRSGRRGLRTYLAGYQAGRCDA